jgi:hypothetical protein
MTNTQLDAIRDLIQEDVGRRGLRTDPNHNLITACPQDFAQACRSLAGTPNLAVVILTGFLIPHAQPPCGETDGPLGALFLARALVPMGAQVVLATDDFGCRALRIGLEACGLAEEVKVICLPSPHESQLTPSQQRRIHKGNQETTVAQRHLDRLRAAYWQALEAQAGRPTHLIALERVGPSHHLAAEMSPEAAAVFSREVAWKKRGRCYTMSGRDISDLMSPAQELFLQAPHVVPAVTTIGIGDGGNEIGMGKIPWEVIRRNIPYGGLIACRVPADYLIVSGVSNWGAYGLAAGVYLLRGRKPDPELFDPERERGLLQVMVELGPLVDGVTGQATVSVDGLSFERYIQPLRRLGEICASGSG